MADRKPAKRPVILPILDRLLQGDNIEIDSNFDRAIQVLRESIRRDLEILFNTRPYYRALPGELDELKTSLIAFGLPDLQVQNLGAESQQEECRRKIEDAIRRFERREMARLFENDQPRIPDAGVHRLCHGERRGVVLFADDHGRRAGNPRQGRAQIGAAQHPAGFRIGREVIGKKHVDAVLDHGGMLCPECIAKPTADLELDEALQPFGQRPLGAFGPLHRRIGAVPRRGIDQTQRICALRKIGGKGQGHATAHRCAGNGR